MEITEVRVKLVDGGRDKLRAFCSITIDDAFVVRDLKVIDGTKGLFVAMPSRKLTSRCPRCGFKNQVRSNYCNDCGTTLPDDSDHAEARGKVHADIAHPIHSECREVLQERVVASYLEEIEASKSPDYRPRDLDEDDGSRDVRTERPRSPVLATGDEPSPGNDASAPYSSSAMGVREERPAETEFGNRGGEPSTRGPLTDLDRDPRARASAAARDGRGRGPAADSGNTGRHDRGAGPRRPEHTSGPPLSEMPPPDDNFSAGIF